MDLKDLKEKLEKIVDMIDKDKIVEDYGEQKEESKEDHSLSSEEMGMLCNQLDSIVVNAIEIKHIIEMTGKSPSWVRSKISVCSSKMSSIRNYFVGKITDF